MEPQEGGCRIGWTYESTRASLGWPEELVFWKMCEKEKTAAIRERIPDLEEPFAALLEEWSRAFARTLEQARTALREAISDTPSEPGREARVPELAAEASLQSREFIHHLQALKEHSAAVRRRPGAAGLLEQACRESAYFLGVADDLRRAGARMAAESGADSGSAGPSPADGAGLSPLSPEGTWSEPLAAGAEAASVPIGGHRLPPLPYACDALEPHIDETTMRLHHDEHHKSYVDGLNQAELKLEEARRTGDFGLAKHWERELAFHGAGHYLHSLFWESMHPEGGGRPSGALARRIDRDFGSFDAFRKQFSEAAGKVEGSGWAILVWSPRGRRLEILTAEKHQNLSQWDVVPLLPLDVWEHAYYLKHRNRRADYVRDWWNVVHWPRAAERFARAQSLRWPAYG
ncbi:DUF2935 domain-containing protein [Cohnella xylanilytica]|uniref:superoxide dismutase n=1 Tax=Cohnella xylanilytica TaxID=557555 RepID=A0A841TXB5_9BACL|nr:DUF2935 domain-containing protein [Cohnella xylanilytica]